jgi:hypothetical protein
MNLHNRGTALLTNTLHGLRNFFAGTTPHVPHNWRNKSESHKTSASESKRAIPHSFRAALYQLPVLEDE